MPGKEQIVKELGEFLLPNLVSSALMANDRAKYFLTLLQTAREHADHPEIECTNLRQERVACGVDEASFDGVVESSRAVNGNYCIPGLGAIHCRIIDSIGEMIAPLELAEAETRRGVHAPEYKRRLSDLVAAAPALGGDLVAGEYIDRITAGDPKAGDGFHVLVMALHKDLNRLLQEMSVESIDGAEVYGILEGDRPLIAAFMRGLNKTRKLKFDHPGLDTTATRASGKLVIQNDIGTTDAHVLVIHVAPPSVTVTYTDVHIQRLVFFQNLFRLFVVRWEDTRSKGSPQLSESLYHLCTGVYTAPSQQELEAYLEFLGSRIVFLIDWNRARKALRKLAPKRTALAVLQWAAENDIGHMGFLKLGGSQIVFDALQLFARTPLPMGGQLSDVIGVERAAEFLKFTLNTAAQGLLSGRSEPLIRDEVRAELRHYIDTAHQGLFELAAEHAAAIVELAVAMRDALVIPNCSNAEFMERLASRAKRWEHQADALVSKARNAGILRAEARAAAELLRIADDVADEIEESIFLLTLLCRNNSLNSSLEVLQELAKLLAEGAKEYLKAVEISRHIDRASSREQMADFLEAVDQTISLEHQSDDAHRRAKATLLTLADDFRQFHLLTEIADKLEESADAVMRSALTLKDYVLGEVISR